MFFFDLGYVLLNFIVSIGTAQCTSFMQRPSNVSNVKCLIFCSIYFADLSPQDSTLLPDVIEVGRLPCLTLEDEATRYCFYILTRHGLRYECFSKSKIQVCQVCLIFYTLAIYMITY